MGPTSAAFEDDDDDDGDPMSVCRWDVIESEGGSSQRVMVGHEDYALAALTSRQILSKNQTVFPDPLPQESSHAKICGPKPKPTKRWFAKHAVWIVPPPGR